MSQWSEKIPKENLSKTVSPTRYLFISFSETWIQINNFRKSSKKFIIDLLTKNIALNLSGAIFFVGLGYSLKWWYKDQLFVVLLKQNLPVLSESQQNRETGKSILNDEYQTWTPLIDRIDLDANHICIKFKQPWQKHFYEQLIGVFGEPAQVNISKQIVTIPFTGEKDWWKEDRSVINNLTACKFISIPLANQRFAWGKELLASHTPEGEPKFSYTNPNPVGVTEQKLRVPRKSSTKMNPTKMKGYANSFQRSFGKGFLGTRSWGDKELPIELKKSCDSKKNLVNKFSTYTLYTYTQKKPLFPKKLFKLSPHNLYFLNQTSQLLQIKDLGSSTKMNPYPTVHFSGGYASEPSVRRKPCKGVGVPSASARVSPLQPLMQIEDLQGARAVTRVNWGSWRSKVSVAELRTEQKDFSKSLTFPDKFSYPLQLTKKLAGWHPFPNLLVLNSYLDEIPCKLENALQSCFPRKNSQLLFLLSQHKKLVIEELEALPVQGMGVGVKAHKGLFSFAPQLRTPLTRRVWGISKNSWVSGPSANYKNSETENNETEKTLDSFKEMFLVSGKQNEQSETYLKKLHLFETKKLLQNQLTSLINSFPIDLVEKSKASVEKNTQSHALQIATRLESGHHLHNNVVNKSNLFEMNGGLLDVSKKILKVKRNTLKKAMDSRVKGPYLPGSSTRYAKSLMYNSCSFQYPLPVGYGVRSKEEATNGANDANDTNLRFARFAKFVPKESVAERYWDTEVYRLTQLFAYSTVANARDAKGLNPLLLLNTLGFTFNNLSPLTNPPIFSSPENKTNAIDKDINFDKNLRYMSGYIYPDIESNSLKAFLYPWLGKDKNLIYPIPLQERACGGAFFECVAGVAGRRSQVVPLEFLRDPSHTALIPYEIDSSLIGNKEKNGPLGNSHYMDNIEIPYKKFNHYLAKFPGFSDPTQFFTTLPQIAGGNENLVNESSILGEPNFVLQERGTKKTNSSKINLDLFETETKIEHVDPFISVGVGEKISTSNIVDKSEINKKLIQKNGCNSRKVAYSGIAVRRNKKTKDFQPFNLKTPHFVKKCKELNFDSLTPYPTIHFSGGLSSNGSARKFELQSKAGSSTKMNPRVHFSGGNPLGYASAKSSIWGTLFLGPENPLTNRQCHFFGQKQLSTLDTKSLQRDYLRELGKEILTQSNLKGYTELSKFSSIERTKILSLSKKVNSFFFKKRKYSYLLEPKDQWHLLFQEQLCSALEDCKKYPLSTIHSFEETNMTKLDSGRIKVSAPLIMARFPKKLVQFRSIHDTPATQAGDVSSTKMNPYPTGKGYKLEQGISWRPFCHLQRSFIYTPLKDNSLTHIPVATHSKAWPNLLTQLSPSLLRIPPTKMNHRVWGNRNSATLVSSKSTIRELVQQEYPHYPLFTERFSEEINALPYLNKNSLFYSTTDSSAITNGSPHAYPIPLQGKQIEDLHGGKLPYPVRGKGYASAPYAPMNSHPNLKNLTNRRTDAALPVQSSAALPVRSSAALPFVTQKNMNKRSVKGIVSTKNNLVGVQNICNSLLIQEPLNYNSWAVLNQWIFLIALLFWIEQTLLNHVFPALFALEQILLSAAGLRTGENNRTHVLRISKNETPKFQNLAGIDGLLGELSELVLFLRGQRNLGVAKLSFWNKWNKKNSYGVLLTGSPGTGKTFLVRALANEANVPVLILSASTLTANKLNNNKPSWSIRHAFKRAKQLAPCILFIDEIDALGKSRGKIVTDINEIVADSAASALTSASHKRILTKFTHNNSANLQQMFSYEQFGQNSSNFNATLLNKWEYPLQSTILQESNEINQNSLCQEKLVDLLKIARGGGYASIGNSEGTSYPLRGRELGPIESTPSGKESATEFKESTSSDIDNKGVLPTLEKEITRGKFGPLTQLLVSMDGVSSFSGVLIMGATNRPELLDPALTRPGRFEKTIRIDKPSEQNRIEILQLYSQNLGVQQQIPWSYLATRTIGLTTADLAVTMNYSSLRAIIQDSVHTLETIEYGLNCITRL